MSGKDALCSTLAAALLLLAAAPVAASAADCPHGGDLVTALSPPDRRAALLCGIDAERAARGLSVVGESRQLSRAAQAHSDDMVVRRFFGHVTPGGSTLGDRVEATGYIAARHDWELGEAIAWAQQPLDTPDSLMRAWLASPGHRAIILDPRFRDVGIGITPGLTDGSDNPGATAVLDFGFRTASPTLPRWRSATACAGTAGRSRQAPARCASTSTRSRLSTQAILRSSTPSATTWKVQLPMSPTTS
ncbi:MAG TPA: CAP domain-containing protein [Solirubrobacteraceae bacterium]|nr:CAP domain-containing protein [Solirubrobacteraceae bacterium]